MSDYTAQTEDTLRFWANRNEYPCTMRDLCRELLARRKRDALHAAAVALAEAEVAHAAAEQGMISGFGRNDGSVRRCRDAALAKEAARNVYREAKAALETEPDWIDRVVEDWMPDGEVRVVNKGDLKRRLRDAYKEQNRDP